MGNSSFSRKICRLGRRTDTRRLRRTGAGAAAPAHRRPGAGRGRRSLAPGVRGLTLLVVGDSWARNLGVGLADADRDRRNVVVNAGEPGCGLMQPVRIQRQGRLLPAPARCNRWPERWQDLVSKYRPGAALLEVGFWDGQDSQVVPGTKDVSSITGPAFRRRFDAQSTARSAFSAPAAHACTCPPSSTTTARRARTPTP